MMSIQYLGEMFFALFVPWQFMWLALSYLPGTIQHLFQTGGLGALLPWSHLKNVWFSRFWAFHGPRIRLGNGPRITALLEGRVIQARVVDDAVVQPISGVVLDIGPGQGYWIDLYANVDGEIRKNAITKVYGVEPNVEVHPTLRKHVAVAGLESVYEILPVGIESISKTSLDGTSAAAIEKGSVDCIVSLLCLCSIPEPEKNIKELYEYLKPGGRWYLFEHVRAKANWPMKVYQSFVNIFWPHVIGGCELCRDTERSLRRAGEWTRIDLAQPPEEQWYGVIPHIFGTMTK